MRQTWRGAIIRLGRPDIPGKWCQNRARRYYQSWKGNGEYYANAFTDIKVGGWCALPSKFTHNVLLQQRNKQCYRYSEWREFACAIHCYYG